MRFARENEYNAYYDELFTAAEKINDDIEGIQTYWRISREFAERLYDLGYKDWDNEDIFGDIIMYWIDYNDDHTSLLTWLDNMLEEEKIDEATHAEWYEETKNQQ